VFVCDLIFLFLITGQPSKLLDAKNADWAPWFNLGYHIDNPVEEYELKIGELSGRILVKRSRVSPEDEMPCNLLKNDNSTEINWPMWQESASAECQVKLEVFDEDFVDWVVPECSTSLETESGPVSVSVQTEFESSSVGVQTDLQEGKYVLRSEFENVTRDNVALRTELQNLKQFVMTEKQLSENNALVKFYTGLPTYSMMKHVLNVVAPSVTHSHRNALSLFQQLLIVLMRLRLNLLEKDLAFRFGVSQTTISKTCEKWLPPMSESLQHLIPWPQRDSYEQSPTSFKTAFGARVVIIVTCFKVVSDRTKHKSSLSFLIGMTSLGKICFVSNSWCDSPESKQGFVKSSGILSKLEQGDVLIADRGVEISDCEEMHQSHPKVPVFTKGKVELPDEEVVSAATICVRTHAERVNVLVRQRFKILQNPVPLELMASKPCGKEKTIDFIVKICCALTYLCPTCTDD